MTSYPLPLVNKFTQLAVSAYGEFALTRCGHQSCNIKEDLSFLPLQDGARCTTSVCSRRRVTRRRGSRGSGTSTPPAPSPPQGSVSRTPRRRLGPSNISIPNALNGLNVLIGYCFSNFGTTEIGKSRCTRFGEFYYCRCLSLLPQLACSIHAT